MYSRAVSFPFCPVFRFPPGAPLSNPRIFRMGTEKAFNALFWALLVLGLSMRSWFAFRVSRTGEPILPDRAAREREGFWPCAVERLFSLLFIALILQVCFQ